MSQFNLIIPIAIGEDGQPRYLMIGDAEGNLGLWFLTVFDQPKDPRDVGQTMDEYNCDVNYHRFLYRIEDKNNIYKVYIAGVKVRGKTCFAQLTAEELQKKIYDNDIVDSVSLAALAAVFFQSPKATQFLMVENNKEV